MTGAPPRPCPKPVRRQPKARKPLRAKRWGVSRSKRGTAHSRRPREFGRMAFYGSLWCLVREFARTGNLEPRHIDAGLVCAGRIEVAHLGKRAGYRRCPDSQTAPLCTKHHRDIDGRVGGRGKWYVELGPEGQRALRERLVFFADNYWQGLTDDQRTWWRDVGAQQKAGS